jgi:hypothetical protein
MIKEFEKLTNEERDLLYRAPVLVSVLASSSFNEMEINKSQKADAIKLAHLKTFTAIPLLIPYYTEVEKCFKAVFEEAIKKYFPFNGEKRNELQKEVESINLILMKLDKEYAKALLKSFDKYAKHVKAATHSVFQDFIFPIPIKGLSY